MCLTVFVNICQAEEYYCGDVKSGYHISNLYNSDLTAEEKCGWLKNDVIIWDIPQPVTYEKCVKDFNIAKAKYNKGMCTPIITKIHPWEGYECTVKSVKGTPTVVKTSCNFDNGEEDEFVFKKSEAAMDYFARMYRRQYGIYDVK